MPQPDIAAIQENLRRHHIDGWLLYDFRRSNDIAHRLLDIPPNAIATRRFFYWIPQKGVPVKIAHRIEPHLLAHLPGDNCPYASWQELSAHLGVLLRDAGCVAMEYSPKNALPYISKVDAGTVEMVSAFGPHIVSSAPLIATPWTPSQIAQHLEAAAFLDRTAALTWQWIADSLLANAPLSEWDVQNFILNEFSVHGFTSDEGALCAVNANSANPHYQACRQGSSPIRRGDFILIDLSCKKNTSDGVYADITRVATASASPTPKQKTVFEIVKEAQQAATRFVVQRHAAKQPIHGYEVDDVARHVITAAGYGSFFPHRTGHNLDTHVHGPGTHMDNLETHDSRPIITNSCFTIEPGIYIPNEFGVRLEYDVLVLPLKVETTGGIQHEIVALL